jgi:hypothetical protein
VTSLNRIKSIGQSRRIENIELIIKCDFRFSVSDSKNSYEHNVLEINMRQWDFAIMGLLVMEDVTQIKKPHLF